MTSSFMREGIRVLVGKCAWISILTVCWTLSPAASFDCSKATTAVEQMICANPVLARLDERLAAAYASARAESPRPDVLRNEQRQWLLDVRDRCGDLACLQSAYEQRLSALQAPDPGRWKTFRDARLGIEFSYPPDRKVRLGCHGSRRCVALVGEPMPRSDYLAAFEVFDGGLEANAAKRAVFERKGDAWVAHGRFGAYATAGLLGPGWRGISATVDCGVSDSLGFHAAAGECLWAVVSEGKRSVVIDTQGIVGNDEATMRSIQSIRFLE